MFLHVYMYICRICLGTHKHSVSVHMPHMLISTYVDVNTHVDVYTFILSTST